MIQVAIAGINGKMGRSILESVLQQKDMVVSEVLARKNNSVTGQKLSELVNDESLDLTISDTLRDSSNTQVLIDFTLPEGTMTLLEQCIQQKIPMVIGTTGLIENQKLKLKEAAETLPILFAPNMSLGVNLCYGLVKQAMQQTMLFQDKNISIVETHHKHKIDAPSGTALALGKVIEDTGYDYPIEYHSIRAGEVVGEHTVTLCLGGERIEITHKASSRKNFSDGAVCAARWLVTQPPGFYSMQDVLQS